ncbi:bromodomain-containing protein DDB_G0280777-like, partial [Manduca sexta]|uniref:bromodomain-containing protein DDB_G0280777-like n=1 Tax=Manduca sexta TaxID=7130 RepID=UPI00188FCA35
ALASLYSDVTVCCVAVSAPVPQSPASHPVPPPYLRPSLSAVFLLQSRNTALAGATEAPTPPSRRPRPHARLDATTYRPHLRPGTGPLQALADQSSDHSALHRRADTYTPAPQQLLTVQGDTKDDQEDSSEQNDEQGELAEEKDEQVKQQATEPTPSHEIQHLPLSLSDSQTVVTSEYYTQQQAHQKASQQAPQQTHQLALQQTYQQQLQQTPQLAYQQNQQQAYDQQRQKQQEPHPSVEVQPPELLVLQYFPSEPEYYPQARQLAQQMYFPQHHQQLQHQQQLQHPQQLQHQQQLQHPQQLQHQQELQHQQQLQQLQQQQRQQQQQQQQHSQQPGPFQYRLVPFDRGFAY